MVKGIEVVREITYGYPWYSLRVIRQNRAEVAPRIERPCTYAIVVEPKATRDRSGSNEEKVSGIMRGKPSNMHRCDIESR